MNTKQLTFEHLREDHDVAAFTCSNPALHDYLRKYALKNIGLGYGQTIVALLERRVVGYYSLCATSVEAKALPAEVMKQMPRYPVPGILLTKMAREASLTGKGWGEIILMQAMATALTAGNHIGWRFLIVDAIDADVVGFYVKYGFKSLPDTPLRLYMSAQTVAQALSLRLK